MGRRCRSRWLARVEAPITARLNSGVSAQEILGLVRGLRKQQVPAWDRVKPRGFARRWASVTNPLVLVATGLKSGQVVGLPTMSLVPGKSGKIVALTIRSSRARFAASTLRYLLTQRSAALAGRLNSGVGLQFGLEVFSRVALPYRVLQWPAPEKQFRQGCAARTGVACGGFCFGAAHRSGCRGVSSSVSFGPPHRGCLWQASVMRSRRGGLRLQALRVSVAAI